MKNVAEPAGNFYDLEYFLALEYRVFSGAHGSRVRNILDCVGYVSGLKVLDAGAGGGAFSELMRERGADVTAIDYSPDTVAFIKSRFPKVKAEHHSVYDLSAFPENSFDVVTLFDVIEHCADQENALKNCVRVLKRGGRLVISTDADHGPYETGLLRRIFYWFEKVSPEGIIYRGIKRAEARRKAWKNYHDSHVGVLSPEELMETVKSMGLKIIDHRIYPVVGSPIRDFFLRFFPKKYRGDHQCLVAVKE